MSRIKLGLPNQNGSLENPQQMFQRLRLERLEKEIFPREFIHPSFKELLNKALSWNSPLRVGRIPLSKWRNMVTFERDFNMMDFELAMDVLYASTPVEMGLSTEAHLIMLESVLQPMKVAWFTIDSRVKESAKRETEVKFKIGGNVPIGTSIVDTDV